MDFFGIIGIALLLIGTFHSAYGGQRFLECFQSCSTTPEYNPVCGTNGESYSNASKFYCAKSCGLSDLAIQHPGNCPKAPRTSIK